MTPLGVTFILLAMFPLERCMIFNYLYLMQDSQLTVTLVLINIFFMKKLQV